MAKFFEYKLDNGKNNMQIDEEILNDAINNNVKEPIIRFYGWNPACVSVGRNQSFENINIDFCRSNNIDIVKRPTGGRALFHDDELTYLFVSPVEYLNSGNSVIESYKEISSGLIEGFKLLGLKIEIGKNKKSDLKHDYCMMLTTGADLCYQDKKIIGSAQFRKKNYVLQHGSLMFSYDKEKINNIFNSETISDNIISLNEINKYMNKYDVIQALKKGFENYFSTF